VSSHDLHLRAGASADGAWDVAVTPEVAGWGWTSLRAADLAPGQELALETGEEEVVVVPLRGGLRVDVEGERHAFELTGRPSVFAGPTDVLYLPAGSKAVLSTSPDGGARVGDLPFASGDDALHLLEACDRGAVELGPEARGLRDGRAGLAR